MTISRIDKIPVEVPSGMGVNVNGQDISVRGPKGILSLATATPITARVEGSKVVVTRVNDEQESRFLHGLTHALVASMIESVTKGYVKVLEIQGTGYRITQKGTTLELALGFSHPVDVEPPKGTIFKIEGNRVTVESTSKGQVGEVAANVHKIHPPESYKDKNVCYLGENVRHKVGKAGK